MHGPTPMIATRPSVPPKWSILIFSMASFPTFDLDAIFLIFFLFRARSNRIKIIKEREKNDTYVYIYIHVCTHKLIESIINQQVTLVRGLVQLFLVEMVFLDNQQIID
jgi:hypothetical protein